MTSESRTYAALREGGASVHNGCENAFDVFGGEEPILRSHTLRSGHFPELPETLRGVEEIGICDFGKKHDDTQELTVARMLSDGVCGNNELGELD